MSTDHVFDGCVLRPPGITRHDGAWLVTGLAETRAVLADRRVRRAPPGGDEQVADAAASGRPPIAAARTIVEMDPPEHTRLRTVVSRAFTPRRIARLRPAVGATVDELVDAMVARGGPRDACHDLTWPLPTRTICALLGVPYDDHARFTAWADAGMTTLATDPDRAAEARIAMHTYLGDLVARRRGEPADDLLGDLARALDDAELDADEIVTFAMTLLVAGYETTANASSGFLASLLARPALWDRLVAEPELVPHAVEELLRHTPLGAVPAPVGTAVAPTTAGEATIAAGEPVLVHLASANRDPRVFDRPDEIDFSRPEIPHVAFGSGPHHCIGASLARLELTVLLATLTRRLPTLRLGIAPEDIVVVRDRLFTGIAELPVTW